MAGTPKIRNTQIDSVLDAYGLKSATTIVSVSSSAAPSNGQVLTATSSTTATWQTPSGGSGSTWGTNELDPATTVGTETILTLSNAPGSAASLFMYRNGILMRKVTSLGTSKMEYTWSATTVTFVASGLSNDWYVAKYAY
jgi:hypothetical protein